MVYQSPTSRLPPIRQISSYQLADLAEAITYLRHIYNPEVRGSHRCRPFAKTSHSKRLATSNTPSGLDDLRADAFERSYAIRWLTTLVALTERWNEEVGMSGSRDPSDTLTKDNIIADAASLLAVCSGTSAAGVITRDFIFEHGSEPGKSRMLKVHLKDVPLDNRDYGSVGAQTWGGACVLAEAILDDPMNFGLTCGQSQGLRILELGAGTGLVSLVVGKLLESLAPIEKPATVIATDYYPSVLDNLKSNIDANFPSSELVNISSHFLDWSHFADTENNGGPSLDLPFDLVLGADIVYEAQHAIWIKSCLKRLLRKPSHDMDPLFHLMIPLRSTHSFESSTVDAVFGVQTPDSTCTVADLRVVAKETILCDAGSGLGSDQIEYAYYKIGWR